MSPAVAQATYAARLTPAGRGAIAVVQIRGAGATGIVDNLFRSASGRRWAEAPLDRIAFGRWGDELGEETVVCRRADSVEVHCHGGRAAVAAVLESLLGGGCKLVKSESWLHVCESDPIRRDAQRDLTQAVTERTALVLLDQVNGALRTAIERIVELIEESQDSEAAQRLATLIERWPVGRRLVEPARIVLAGPPNVGKSSLINALLGYERAIVFDQPGTTRDAVAAASAIDGLPVEFIDTAGLRTTASQLEQAGIEVARSTIASADILVSVDEAPCWRQTSDPAADLHGLRERQPLLHVVNKIDQLDRPGRELLASRCESDESLVPTSALTGEGIEALLERLSAALAPAAPTVGAAVPFRQAHVACLAAAADRLASDDRRGARQALLAMLSADSHATIETTTSRAAEFDD